MPSELQQRLLTDMVGPSVAYVHRGVDERAYLEGLREGIRTAMCEPYRVQAQVVEPAFPFAAPAKFFLATALQDVTATG
jgi:hypothetical protein